MGKIKQILLYSVFKEMFYKVKDKKPNQTNVNEKYLRNMGPKKKKKESLKNYWLNNQYMIEKRSLGYNGQFLIEKI